LDPNKELAIWYPDEVICKNNEFSNMLFIKQQRKIAKVNEKNKVKGIFTYNMLNRDFIVKSGIKGIDEQNELSDFVK
jgi:hypothetical protein